MKLKTERRYFTADGVQVTLAGGTVVEGKSQLYGYALDDYEWKHRLLIARAINYNIANPSLHECNAHCQGASGPNCECQCGGKNHGGGRR